MIMQRGGQLLTQESKWEILVEQDRIIENARDGRGQGVIGEIPAEGRYHRETHNDYGRRTTPPGHRDGSGRSGAC